MRSNLLIKTSFICCSSGNGQNTEVQCTRMKLLTQPAIHATWQKNIDSFWLKAGGGGGGGYLLCWGTWGCAIFLGILFARKFWSRIYYFCPKILKQDTNFEEKFWSKVNFAGKPSKFLRWTYGVESKKPYCLKSGKIHSKITENVGKFQNWGAKFWNNGTTWCCYWPKILKPGVFFGQIF